MRSNHALQAFSASCPGTHLMALWSIDCHARPYRPWAECVNVGVCNMAGSLWTRGLCRVAAWEPVI